MTPRLIECAACRAHVRSPSSSSDQRCPFCGHELQATTRSQRSKRGPEGLASAGPGPEDFQTLARSEQRGLSQALVQTLRAARAPSVHAMATALLGLGLAGCEADSGQLVGDRDPVFDDTGAIDPVDSVDTGPVTVTDGGAVDTGAVVDTGVVDGGAVVDLGVDGGADTGSTIPVPLYGQPPPNVDGSVQVGDVGAPVDASEEDSGFDTTPIVPLYGISPPPVLDGGENPDATS